VRSGFIARAVGQVGAGVRFRMASKFGPAGGTKGLPRLSLPIPQPAVPLLESLLARFQMLPRVDPYRACSGRVKVLSGNSFQQRWRCSWYCW